MVKATADDMAVQSQINIGMKKALRDYPVGLIFIPLVLPLAFLQTAPSNARGQRCIAYCR